MGQGEAPELSVEKGICYALFAYDVGLAIDLSEAGRRITALKQRTSLKHTRRAPRYFEYRPAPLRVTFEIDPLALGEYRSGSTVDLVLYDFGAVAVTYNIPLEGALSRRDLPDRRVPAGSDGRRFVRAVRGSRLPDPAMRAAAAVGAGGEGRDGVPDFLRHG